ncbi:MAG: 5'/3'-nucleotidase SurE [Thermoguttaceae bacterium]
MIILLTNDDGIYAPELAALQRQLSRLGEVYVVAPATEQSGVGHSITYLTPLIVKEVYLDERQWGWAVEGSPADCVKIGISELCPARPDLVVSGINGGLNAGINVLYSGTVAAAIEGAFYRITSIAVSLEYDEHAQFDKAARIARSVIGQILDNKGPEPQLYNINIPTTALEGMPEIRTVPMDVTLCGEDYERRTDPFGRVYYWATSYPPPALKGIDSDLASLKQGYVTVTPLDYNMTKLAVLQLMQSWPLRIELSEEDVVGGVRGPEFRTRPKR